MILRKLFEIVLLAVLLAPACTARRGAPACVPAGSYAPLSPGPRSLDHVFVIVLENANWTQVRGNPSMPYLNGTLLAQGAHSEQYFNPPGVHPSEPNYLWMEAGTDLGVRDDSDPLAHHFDSSEHLVSLFEKANVSWKSYQQGIAAGECPMRSHGLYAAKHNPFVFFDDVTRDASYCSSHIRPLEELQADLAAGTVARYVFVTPDLCHDMHGAPGCPADLYRTADDFLAEWVPRIQASTAYGSGVIFVTWDEGEGSDGPIGMIALSPLARAGYASRSRRTHGSLLRTVQEIFAVGPLLCDAAAAENLSDLFNQYP